MAKKPKTTVELINDAAADPELTPRKAVLNIARLAMHLGVTDPAKLKLVGAGLGHICQGIGKVAVAEASKGGGDTDNLLDWMSEQRED